jgi:hypothetical protein
LKYSRIHHHCGGVPKGSYEAAEVRKFKLPLFYQYAAYLSRLAVEVVKGIHENKREIIVRFDFMNSC